MTGHKPCLATVLSEISPEGLAKPVEELVQRAAGGRLEYVGEHRSSGSLRRALRGCTSAAIIVGSGGTEHVILDGASSFRGPLLLVSYDAYNSLPALAEVLPALREERGGRLWQVHTKLGLRQRDRRLEAALRGLLLADSLQGARLGIIGGPSPWLVFSRMPNEAVSQLGIEPVDIPLSAVIDYYYEVPREEAESLAEKLAPSATSQVRGEGLVRAVTIYLALKRIVSEYNLDAFTIRCFDLIPVLDASPCLALALLNSEGVVAGCEGDVPAAVTMMILSRASGGPVMMGNLADLDDDTVTIAHCTAPLRLGNYQITTHMETGKPGGVSVTLPTGRPVTLARIHPRLQTLLLARGRLVQSRPRPRLCRTQATVRVEGGARWMLDESPGNHWVLALGDHIEEAQTIAALLGLQPVRMPA